MPLRVRPDPSTSMSCRRCAGTRLRTERLLRRHRVNAVSMQESVADGRTSLERIALCSLSKTLIVRRLAAIMVITTPTHWWIDTACDRHISIQRRKDARTSCAKSPIHFGPVFMRVRGLEDRVGLKKAWQRQAEIGPLRHAEKRGVKEIVITAYVGWSRLRKLGHE